MTKRLQVLLDETELEDIQKMARQQQMTVAEWDRQVLRRALQGQSRIDAEIKLDATRRAVGHSFPVGDIEQMLGEIEKGYLSDTKP